MAPFLLANREPFILRTTAAVVVFSTKDTANMMVKAWFGSTPIPKYVAKKMFAQNAQPAHDSLAMNVVVDALPFRTAKLTKIVHVAFVNASSKNLLVFLGSVATVPRFYVNQFHQSVQAAKLPV